MLFATSAFKAAFCNHPGWFEISSLEGLKRTTGIHYARFNYLPEVSTSDVYPTFLALDKKMYFSDIQTRTKEIPNLNKWSSSGVRLTIPKIAKSIADLQTNQDCLPKFMPFSSLCQITLKYRSKQYCLQHGLATTASLGRVYIRFLQDLKGPTPVVPRGRIFQCSNQHDIDFFTDPGKAFEAVEFNKLLSYHEARKNGISGFFSGKENSMRLFFTKLFEAKEIPFVSEMMNQIQDHCDVPTTHNSLKNTFHPLADVLVKMFVSADSRFYMNFSKEGIRSQWCKAPNLLNCALCLGLDNEKGIDLMVKLVEQGCNPKQRVKTPALNRAHDFSMKKQVSAF